MKVASMSAISTGRIYPPPMRYHWYYFLLRGLVDDPRATVRLEGFRRWKTLMTSTGIEPAIFSLVKHCPAKMEQAYMIRFFFFFPYISLNIQKRFYLTIPCMQIFVLCILDTIFKMVLLWLHELIYIFIVYISNSAKSCGMTLKLINSSIIQITMNIVYYKCLKIPLFIYLFIFIINQK